MPAPAQAAQAQLEQAAPAPAPEPAAAPAKGKPAAVPAPPKAAPESETKPEAEGPKEKPKAKPEPRQAAADKREGNIQKFARAMNAEAEKDGVALDAPTEERRAKPGPKPGVRRAAAPATEAEGAPAKPEPAAQANPTPEPETARAEPEEPEDDDGDGAKAEPRSVHQLKAKARLRHGDADKALRLAFGDLKPEEYEGAKEALAKKLGVSSKQWADFRRHEAAERAKVRTLETNAVQLSQRLRTEFEPMLQARKAFAAGDYPAAFQHAFGEDINSFQRKAIHQHLSQDPEKTRLQQQIDELRSELGKQRQPPEASPEQQQRAAMQREGDRTHETLTQSDDPEIAHFAKRASFIRRVVELRGEHYDPQTRTTLPMHVAADMVRDEIKRSLSQWRLDEPSGDGAQNSELPSLAGNEPARTSQRARSPNPSQAAQAGGSTRSMTREERIKAFASRM